MIFGLLFLMVLSFPLGLYIIFYTDLGKNSTLSIKIIFIIVWFIYFILFIQAVRGPLYNINKVPRAFLQNNLRVIFTNTASTLAGIFPALLLVVILITQIQEGIGIPTGSLSEVNPILDYLSDSIAPIIEEFVFRIFFIGIVASSILMIKSSSFDFKIFWWPAKYFSNLKSEIKIIYLVIVISGILFGFAHLAFGGGWDIGKVTTSSLVGIVLGLFYFFYGIPACILLHWSFNYFIGSFYYFDEIVNGSSLTNIIDIMLILIGIVSIVFLFIYIIQKKKIYPLQSTHM